MVSGSNSSRPYVRLLHFMWVDPSRPGIEAPPDGVPQYVDRWRATHADWRVVFWNLDRCRRLFRETAELRPLYRDVFETPWMSAYAACDDPSFATLFSCPVKMALGARSGEMYNRMALADTCRLAVLYAYGGVYADLSMNPLFESSLDAAWRDHPERATLYSWEARENYIAPVVLNSLLGARVARHPMWLDYLRYVCATKNTPRQLHKFFAQDPVTDTGPHALATWVSIRRRTRLSDGSLFEEPLPTCAFSQRTRGGAYARGCDPDEKDVSMAGRAYAEKLWKSSSGWGGGGGETKSVEGVSSSAKTAAKITLSAVLVVLLGIVALYTYDQFAATGSDRRRRRA